MNNKAKVVYVLNVSNYELDIQYSVGVYSNIDLAMKKVFDSISNDMASFNTLLSLSKIAYPTDASHSSYPTNLLDASHSDNNGNTTHSKDIVDSATNILKLVVKNSLEELDDDDISEELFLKIQHLIPNPNQYEPQDLYEEFLSYLSHWAQLFKRFCITSDDSNHIQEKIKQIADGYQELYVVKEYPDFDHVNFTFEQLKQRYPNISFNQYSSSDNNFHFSIYDYWNMEIQHDSYDIVRFVLDE